MTTMQHKAAKECHTRQCKTIKEFKDRFLNMSAVEVWVMYFVISIN